MRDSDLRALERRAEETGAPADWRRYYAERRRFGWDQPAGEAAWDVEIPEGARPVRLAFANPTFDVTGFVPGKRDEIASVGLEWARCGTGVPVQVVADGLAMVTAPWEECVTYPTGILGLSFHPASVIPMRPQQPGGLLIGGVGRSFAVLGPEFLGDPIAYFLREPTPTPVIQAGSGGRAVLTGGEPIGNVVGAPRWIVNPIAPPLAHGWVRGVRRGRS